MKKITTLRCIATITALCTATLGISTVAANANAYTAASSTLAELSQTEVTETLVTADTAALAATTPTTTGTTVPDGEIVTTTATETVANTHEEPSFSEQFVYLSSQMESYSAYSANDNTAGIRLYVANNSDKSHGYVDHLEFTFTYANADGEFQGVSIDNDAIPNQESMNIKTTKTISDTETSVTVLLTPTDKSGNPNGALISAEYIGTLNFSLADVSASQDDEISVTLTSANIDYLSYDAIAVVYPDDEFPSDVAPDGIYTGTTVGTNYLHTTTTTTETTKATNTTTAELTLDTFTILSNSISYDDYIAAGNIITCPLYYDNNPGESSLVFTIRYTTSECTFEGITIYNDAIPDKESMNYNTQSKIYSDQDITEVTITLTPADTDGNPNGKMITADKIGELQFTLADGATYGTSTTVSMTDANTLIFGGTAKLSIAELQPIATTTTTVYTNINTTTTTTPEGGWSNPTTDCLEDACLEAWDRSMEYSDYVAAGNIISVPFDFVLNPGVDSLQFTIRYTTSQCTFKGIHIFDDAIPEKESMNYNTQSKVYSDTDTTEVTITLTPADADGNPNGLYITAESIGELQFTFNEDVSKGCDTEIYIIDANVAFYDGYVPLEIEADMLTTTTTTTVYDHFNTTTTTATTYQTHVTESDFILNVGTTIGTSPTTTEYPITTTTHCNTTYTTTSVRDGNGTADMTTATTTQYHVTDYDLNSIIYGDTNGDNAVNLSDLILLTKICAGQVQNTNALASDCNCDGVTDSTDAVILQKFLLNIISSLPYES